MTIMKDSNDQSLQPRALTIEDIRTLEETHRSALALELQASESWARWCLSRNDHHGINFHHGLKAGLRYHDVRMRAVLRTLKGESVPYYLEESLDYMVPSPTPSIWSRFKSWIVRTLEG